MKDISYLKEGLYTNYKEVDSQHELFFRICNLVILILSKNKEKVTEEMLSNIYKLLINYINFHLNSEEDYLHSIKNPSPELKELIEKNIIEHQFFRKKVINDISKIKNLEDKITELRNFSFNWFNQHILRTDKSFCSLMKQLDIYPNKNLMKNGLQEVFLKSIIKYEKEYLN